MPLYSLPASNFQAFFGTQDQPLPRNDVNIIAQKTDCSAFLVLSNTAYPELDAFTSYDGYDFTYCQGWGLTINDEVVARTILDLRKNAYPPIADYLDGVVKGNQAQMQAYVDACLAVKARYPKKA
jgi:hypothetical protein